MSLEPKRLAAAFFIPRQGDDLPIEKLLEMAGASNISIFSATLSDGSGLVDCRWAGMSCQSYLDELPYHQLLEIYFWQSDFLELLSEEDDPIALDADEALPLAQAFKHSCEALSPEVAFLVTHLDQAQRDFILSREWMVLAKEANGLADERFGLLFLNEEVSKYWISHPLRDDRDSLPISSGKLVFAGRGSSRWF
jgi:hypothetical protein